MALKFLNKKGWHTGSIRNIENVWKAEQKHEAENRKLDELRKQILEERERDEFRALQEKAGLTPRQERLEFLYDSGLSVGKTSDGFQALGTTPTSDNSAPPSASAAASSSEVQPAVPGALFEDKPQSANDAWRKLHTDPLLMIRQREQEALSRIKNNPVKMAMIRKSVESKKKDDESYEREHQNVKSKHKKHSSSKLHSESESDSHEERETRRKMKHKRKKRHSETESDNNDERERNRKLKNRKRENHSDTESESNEERERTRKMKDKKKGRVDSDEDSRDRIRSHRYSHRDYESDKQHCRSPSKQNSDRNKDSEFQRGYEKSKHSEYHPDDRNDKFAHKAIDNGRSHQVSESKHTALPPRHDSYRRRGRAPQLSEEERAARLREMQIDAETHEEQRWKRLKKAADDDAREASQADNSRGKSFLNSVQKSVYGAEKGGSSTIEESVRRRSHFLQGRTADDRNAFRR